MNLQKKFAELNQMQNKLLEYDIKLFNSIQLVLTINHIFGLNEYIIKGEINIDNHNYLIHSIQYNYTDFDPTIEKILTWIEKLDKENLLGIILVQNNTELILSNETANKKIESLNSLLFNLFPKGYRWNNENNPNRQVILQYIYVPIIEYVHSKSDKYLHRFCGIKMRDLKFLYRSHLDLTIPQYGGFEKLLSKVKSEINFQL
jgi:hypothetical protein